MGKIFRQSNGESLPWESDMIDFIHAINAHELASDAHAGQFRKQSYDIFIHHNG